MSLRFREFNRVTIEERMLHRYVFERLYLGDEKIKKQLLPERLHKKKLNLIVPEPHQRETPDGGSRPDLDLYFTDDEKAVPSEAKWDANDLVQENQRYVLKQERGFCIALNLPSPKNRIDGIDYVQIPYKDLRRWLAENAPLLLDETVQAKVSGEITAQQMQYWLIPIRGPAKKNFDKMLSKHSRHPFWAFQNKILPVTQVLQMKEGDQCVFLCFKGKPGHMRLPQITKSHPSQIITVNEWHEGTIRDPYHMRLEPEWGNFFEKTVGPISSRKWPHFIGMDLEAPAHAEQIKNFTDTILAQEFTDAVNKGDAALPLSQMEYDHFIQHLRHGNR